MNRIVLLSVLLFILSTVIAIQPTFNERSFFKEVAKDLLKDIVGNPQGEDIVSDNEKELADSLVDVIEEDCVSVCPPKKEGDVGAHVIQCIQCISEEFGTPMLPEFLEAVLTIRSPELTESGNEKEESNKESGGAIDEQNLEYYQEPELDEMIEDGPELLKQVTDLFEDAGLALFTALLGPCKEYCSFVTVPNTDPVPCIKCMSNQGLDESVQIINGVLALLSA